MRKVLIIAYYWPPAGGGGVQRWLKFTKYLPEFGWQPIVYVPYNPQYPLADFSLLQQVPEHVQTIRGHIWEARRFYRRLKKLRHGRSWNTAPEMDTLFFREPDEISWFGRFSLFLRSNLFIPDSRSLWIKPSHRRLKKWLKENPVDLIVSTGPPHSCHLIGRKLRLSTGIPWVADFRDPWLEIDYFPLLMLTDRNRRRHERMQHQVLTTADHVTTVSSSWANLFKGYGARAVSVITNGFDNSDIERIQPPKKNDGKLRIASVGTLEIDRSPTGLWNALRILIKYEPALREKIEVHFAGKVDGAVFIGFEDLADVIVNHGYVSHEEALTMMHQADILLLPLNQMDSANTLGRIPGKLFEYIAFRKPILMLGSSNSDAGKIVSDLGNSWCVPSDDHEAITAILRDFMENESHSTALDSDISRFERRTLTRALSMTFEQVIDSSTPLKPRYSKTSHA